MKPLLLLLVFADYFPLLLASITFNPAGPSVECININIVRDSLVEENEEMFSFVITPVQADEALVVGSPSSSTVTITDEPNGKHHFCKSGGNTHFG